LHSLGEFPPFLQQRIVLTQQLLVFKASVDEFG
jgi:hypothetical protein